MSSDSPAHASGPEHDPNSSSSTLVTSNTPAQEPASPFSASFDPNGPTPPAQQHALALRDSPLHPITEVRLPTNGVDVSALWAHRLSASFGAIADQIAAASQALATVPVPPNATVSSSPSAADSGDAEILALKTRMDIIERTQEKLGADLQQMQSQLARMQVSGRSEHAEKQRADVAIVEVQGEEGTSEFKTAAEIAIEELQKKVDGAIDTIKLDQARLYARLHNATVTTNKMFIKAPMMANGKTPQNFPNTKGEFEHLTKERYEHLLKSYNLPIKGDTAAKREALREFIGLTPAN